MVPQASSTYMGGQNAALQEEKQVFSIQISLTQSKQNNHPHQTEKGGKTAQVPRGQGRASLVSRLPKKSNLGPAVLTLSYTDTNPFSHVCPIHT